MNEAPMDFTGERYIPELEWPEISYEHWHRYLYAEGFVEEKSVLDVACGEGYGCHWMARRAEMVVGVDVSEEAIVHAHVRYPGRNLSFLQGGADLLPLEGKELFDVVTSFETIEHIDIPMQERFLLEIKRVLKPNGSLLISTPNKYEYSDLPKYSNDFHIKEFYESEFVEFLSRSFRHVSLLGQRVYPASFIWPLRESRDSEIRQMHFGELGFGPLVHDARRALYFVAIASDEPIEAAISSTLIDVSSRALTNRQQELIDRTAAWQKELAARHMLERVNEALSNRVAELMTYVDRCSELETELDQVARERSYLCDAVDEFQSSTTWKLSHAIKRLLPRRNPNAARPKVRSELATEVQSGVLQSGRDSGHDKASGYEGSPNVQTTAAFPDDGTLTDEMERVIKAEARTLGVEPYVHPHDFIYRFCCTHPLLTVASGTEYYFEDGQRSARKLDDIVAGLDDLDPASVSLLEFASGYGCVTRHLKRLPKFKLVACDIHPEAIDFLTRRIGVRSILSTRQPGDFSQPRSYDVVFALSFFSHMPARSFGGWLRALYRTLSVPGYLIFTTHGLKSCPHMGITPADIPADGFWFRAGSEQFDLDTADYGTTISTPDFVIGEIFRQTGAPIVAYRHAGWWEHQDLWVVKRLS